MSAVPSEKDQRIKSVKASRLYPDTTEQRFLFDKKSILGSLVGKKFIFKIPGMESNFRIAEFTEKDPQHPYSKELVIDDDGFYFEQYNQDNKKSIPHYKTLEEALKAFDEELSKKKAEEKHVEENIQLVKRQQIYIDDHAESKSAKELQQSNTGTLKIFNKGYKGHPDAVSDEASFVVKAKTKRSVSAFDFSLVKSESDNQLSWKYDNELFKTLDEMLAKINLKVKSILEAEKREDEATFKTVQAMDQFYAKAEDLPKNVAVGIVKSKEGDGYNFVGHGKKGLLTVENVIINPDGSCEWMEDEITFDKIEKVKKTAANITEAFASIQKYFETKAKAQQEMDALLSKAELKIETDIEAAKQALQDKGQPPGSIRIINAKDGELLIVGKNDKGNLDVYKGRVGPHGILISPVEGEYFSIVNVKDINELQEVVKRHLNFGPIPTKSDVEDLAKRMKDKDQAEYDNINQIMLMMDFDDSLSNGHFHYRLQKMGYPYGHVPTEVLDKLFNDYGLKNKELIVATWKYVLNKGGSIYIGSLSRYPGVIERAIDILSDELMKQGVSAEALKRIHYKKPDIFTEPKDGPGENQGKDPQIMDGMLKAGNPKIRNVFLGEDDRGNIERAEQTFPGINTVTISQTPEEEEPRANIGKSAVSPLPIYYREFYEKIKAHASGKEDAELRALREAIERDPQLRAYVQVKEKYRDIGGGDAEEELESKENPPPIVRRRDGTLENGFFGISMKVGPEIEHYTVRFDDTGFHFVDSSVRGVNVKNIPFVSLDEVLAFLKYPKYAEVLSVVDRNIDESYDAEQALARSDKSFLVRRTQVGDLKDGVFAISMKVNNKVMHATLFVDDQGYHFKTPTSSIWRGQDVKDKSFKSLKDLTDFMQTAPSVERELKAVQPAVPTPTTPKGKVQSLAERFESVKSESIESKETPHIEPGFLPKSPKSVKAMVQGFESMKDKDQGPRLKDLTGATATPTDAPTKPSSTPTEPKSPKKPKPGGSGSGEGTA